MPGDKNTPKKQGLYLISPPVIEPGFGELLQAVLDVGAVALFQFRVKHTPVDQAAALAAPLLQLCRAYGVDMIVNDSIALAHKIGAHGVHLGQKDAGIAEARRVLGAQARIGITCRDSRDLAAKACQAGADYVAFGSFFASATKTVKARPRLDILRYWSQHGTIPCVAIGGITPDNARPLLTAGADFLAVSGAIWQDMNHSADQMRAFARLLDAEKAGA